MSGALAKGGEKQEGSEAKTTRRDGDGRLDMEVEAFCRVDMAALAA